MPLNQVRNIEERKYLCKREKFHCHLTYEYFVKVNQLLMMIVEFMSR